MISKKPSIFIYTLRPDGDVLQEICAGMEEEGVLFQVFEREEGGLDALAWQAANDSMLGCGVGILEGSIAFQMRGLKIGQNVEAYPNASRQQSRILGANSARAIKKLPFKSGFTASPMAEV